MAALAPPGLLTGCHHIQAGDEQHLLPAESASMATRENKARTASGAGRHIAHELLLRMGSADLAVLRGRSGNPIWPAGIIGSIAHDDEMAVAVVARAGAVRSVGIDIEPALPLPPDLLSVVAASQDRLGDLDPGLGGRILFAVKEAAYKASFPLDGLVLGFEDIAVDFQTGEAVTSFGRRLAVRFAVTPRILALAYPA
ncbi:MAG: 4'-phosphopantetheinyl transferase [Pseudomonadota bacterium]